MSLSEILTRFKDNWKSGLTVALVSIPLSISLAVAANATPLMGIITAVWAGLLAAFFGGSNFNIVGPTGALSGVLASYAILHGAESLPILAVTAGLIILLFYILKLGKYIIYIPASVVHGFTLGVAFIIALNQLNFATGLSGLPVHESFIGNVFESIKHFGQVDFFTFALFGAGLIFLLLWNRFLPKFPGPIVLSPIGILIGYMSAKGTLGFELQTLFTKFGEIEMKLFVMPEFSLDLLNRGLLLTAVTVAIIAILETLISAKIADGMTKTKFHKKKELVGLGLANVVCGIAGGIPATAALARTALNVKSGATHKTSAGISSVFIAIISVLLLTQFKYLPLAVVASILVYVAIRMIQAEHFVHLFKHDKSAFILSMIVAGITIIEDPIIGILVGATFALLMFVNRLSHGQAEITMNKNNHLRRTFGEKAMDIKDHGEVLVYRFSGILTYINALSHTEIFEHIKKPHTVILAFRTLYYIDLDGLDALEEIVEILENRKIKVMFTGVSTLIKPILNGTDFYKKKKKQGLVFEHTADALEHVGLC